MDLPAMEVYINADLFCENTNFLIRFPSCVIVFLHFVYQVMVATFRCDQIAKETLSRLNSDKVFLFSVSSCKTFCATLM